MIYNAGGCPLRRHANVDSLLPVAVPTVTPGWRTLTRACGGQEVRRTGATTTTADGTVAQDPAGNLKPAKDKSTERIDGVVALIMAIGRAVVAQEEPYVEYSLFWV